MRGSVIVAVIVSTTAALAAAAYWWWFLRPTPESTAIAVCEALLADRLRASATYRRVSAEVVEERFPYDRVEHVKREMQVERHTPLNELLPWDDAKEWKRRDDFERENAEYRDGTVSALLTVRLRYDATNAFGTPLRGDARCQWIRVLSPETPFGLQPYDKAFGGLVITD